MRGKRQIRGAGKGGVYIGERNAGVRVGRHGSKLHIGVAKHQSHQLCPRVTGSPHNANLNTHRLSPSRR